MVRQSTLRPFQNCAVCDLTQENQLSRFESLLIAILLIFLRLLIIPNRALGRVLDTTAGCFGYIHTVYGPGNDFSYTHITSVHLGPRRHLKSVKNAHKMWIWARSRDWACPGCVCGLGTVLQSVGSNKT